MAGRANSVEQLSSDCSRLEKHLCRPHILLGEPMTETIRIAVIGSGHLGRFHARLIKANADFQLVGVVDPDTEARNALAQELEVAGFDSYQPLLEKIDAAVIATPTEYHHRIGMELLLAGKHLLIEKPLAGNVSESDALVECAAIGNRILQVGHIERFNPAFLAIHNKIENPKFIETSRFSGYSFRSTDIGVVLDLMIHDVDIILSMVHARPIRVEAIGASVIGPQEDIANARIVFEDGCIANLSASRVSYDVVRKMQIWSPESFIAVDYSDTTARVARPSESLLRGDYDVQQLSLAQKQEAKQRFFDDWITVEKIEADPCNALDNELQDFAEAIKTASSPRVPGSAGRDAVAVCEQILVSLAHHAWDGHPHGAIGLQSMQEPDTIPVTPFGMIAPMPRRRAG